jgi:ABC-type multidrug transport system fused ATPase/permease subunit
VPFLKLVFDALQSLVSLRRIEKYLDSKEVSPIPSLGTQQTPIAFQSATVTWPRDRLSGMPSAANTPRTRTFVLVDLNLSFPRGALSLVCGKLGSGKSLLLHALLGEADFLTGQVLCPRSPPDAIVNLSRAHPSPEDWVVEGVCAYVPQAAWLRNASIKGYNFYVRWQCNESCELIPRCPVSREHTLQPSVR